MKTCLAFKVIEATLLGVALSVAYFWLLCTMRRIELPVNDKTRLDTIPSK